MLGIFDVAAVRRCFASGPLLCVVVVLTCATAQAQNEIPPFRAYAEVELVNVDVVVTDGRGKPVRGLRQNQFAIYEDGVKQDIAGFEVVDRISHSMRVEGTTAPDPAAIDELPRVVLFIDNMSLHPHTRNKVIEFSSRFAREVLQKGGEVMVVTSAEGAVVRLPFTREAAAVDETLAAVARELGRGALRPGQMRLMQSEILASIDERDALRTARNYAFSVKNEVERTVEGLRAACRMLAPLSGRKAMVILSDGLPIDPGSDAFRFVEVARGSTTSIAPFMVPEFSLSHLMRALAESASTAGVALYPIHARGLSGMGSMLADETFGGLAASPRNNVPDLGGGRYAFGIERGQRPTFANAFVVERESELATRASMELLATMTGGFATVGSGDFRKTFEGITRDLDTYYTLTYQRTTHDRQRHNISVEVPGTRYRARFRRTNIRNSPEEQARDLVTSALSVPPVEKNGLQLTMSVYAAQREKRAYRIPVEISVPMSRVTLADGTEGHTTALRLFVRVADGRQRMTQIGEKIVRITIPASQLENVLGKYYTTQLDLVAEPGNYRIAAVLLDQNSLGTGTAVASFHAGELRPERKDSQ